MARNTPGLSHNPRIVAIAVVHHEALLLLLRLSEIHLAPKRPTARFRADKEEVAAQKIAGALEALGAGAQDLALCQAAAGGDLLFLEA